MYILIKTILTTENGSTVLHNFFLLYMSIFNELVIENDPIKKINTINTKNNNIVHEISQIPNFNGDYSDILIHTYN